MSYAADHLAWKQRVGKEHAVASSSIFTSPYKQSVKFPTQGVAELYGQEYSQADPNLMGHYDVKRTLKSLVSNEPLQRVFSPSNKTITDRYGRIIGNTTFQSTQKISFSPVSKYPKSLMFLANGVKSPAQKHSSSLLKSASNGMLVSPRKAKAKPFFDQAYMPKSQVESLSQIGSKISRLQHSLTKLKPKNREAAGELPLLKKERFNEDVISEYSFKSKQHRARVKNDLQHNSDLKRMLIKSVESMNPEEIEIMNNALNMQNKGSKITQYLDENYGELNQTNLEQLEELNEDGFDNNAAVNNFIDEGNDAVNESELQDEVYPLEEIKRNKKTKNPSLKSKVSSAVISQLESKIEEEKRIRMQMENEIEEIKRMNSQLLEHIKNQKHQGDNN